MCKGLWVNERVKSINQKWRKKGTSHSQGKEEREKVKKEKKKAK